jgi:hypothetical protein
MFGLILGLAIGAGAAFVYKLANEEGPITGDSPIDKLRLQARQAKLEGEIAQREKEAQLLQEYEQAVHRPTPPPQP